jgi:hypothetical protein
VATWDELAAGSPDLADLGRRLLTRAGIGEALLGTARAGGLLRINPVYAEIVAGRLLTFIQAGSAKAADLDSDDRYALHTHVDPVAPDEFAVRGRVREVGDLDLTERALAAWAFDAHGDGYRLFELDVEHAQVGRRPTADDWPPVYTSWRADSAARVSRG